MYAIISAVINGAAAKCVLLGRYRRIEETLIVKKTLFGVRTKTHREEKRKCIVFIPYRQALKEIAEIDESQVLTANAAIPADYVKANSFTYATGETYPGEFEIRDFCGCPLLLEDASFLENVLADERDACLESLYRYDPTLASLCLEP